MNPLGYRRILSLGHMPAGPSLRRACVFFTWLALCIALAGHAQKHDTDPGLIAHEWGTFTSIAGEAGQAVEVSSKQPHRSSEFRRAFSRHQL